MSVASIKAKIAALEVKLAAAVLAEANTITADKLPEGTEVTFVSGKDKQPASGTVLAVVTNPKGGTVVKVFVKDGANSRVASPFLAQITGIVGAEVAADTVAA